MSTRLPTFTLLGSNSGRNAGDAAILGAIMRSLCETANQQLYFEVPTTHPKFVKTEYGSQFNVKPINVMPWTGSLRLLGLPTFRSIKRTDVTMITDGIIFDINLWNPLFNYLITLIFLVPWAKFWGKKVVCYNVGIGPLESFWGRTFARWVGNRCDLIMVRDEDSRDLFRKIGVKKTIFLTADSVFQGWSAPSERIDEIISSTSVVEDAFLEDRVLGVNITKYIDRWLKKNQKVSSSEGFVDIFARSLARLKVERNVESVLVLTQVMDYDCGVNLANRVSESYKSLCGREWRPLVVSNREYNNHEIMGVCSRCRLFIGMRLHSLIIACRSGTPVVGLVYAPKVRSFLKQLNSSSFSLELNEVTEASLFDTLLEAWESSDQLKATQQEVQVKLSKGASEASAMVLEDFAGSDFLDDSMQKSDRTKLVA